MVFNGGAVSGRTLPELYGAFGVEPFPHFHGLKQPFFKHEIVAAIHAVLLITSPVYVYEFTVENHNKFILVGKPSTNGTDGKAVTVIRPFLTWFHEF